MLKKKSLWILLIIIPVVAAGGYYYYTSSIAAQTAQADEGPALQTAVARLGDLTVFASGAGKIVPASEISLGFDQSGTLIELGVGVGEEVLSEDVLARLQTKDSPESIAASISEAELSVLKAQKALDDLYTNAGIARTKAMADIATYAQAVRDSQYQLDLYTVPSNLAGLDVMEALDLTKDELDQASQAFEPYKHLSSGNETRQELLDELTEAQSNYNAAVRRLEYEHDLEVAEANLEKARGDYDRYKDGPDLDEVALAEAELANAQARLALAQEAQAVLELVAPVDGTVMALQANVGEYIGTNPIITLADLDKPLLEVYLDETDLDKVAVGYDAEIVFDALPEQIFTGHVIQVDPALQTISGVQAVKALVLLDGDGQSQNLPVGLNASVDIIAGRAVGVVLVPVEALRELGTDEYAVFVVVDDEPLLRVVEVGLVDITSAEITSGLKAGEVVTTGIVETQ